MKIEILKEALNKEKEARKNTEYALKKKCIELHNTINELALAKKELSFQNKEKEKRAEELVLLFFFLFLYFEKKVLF